MALAAWTRQLAPVQRAALTSGSLMFLGDLASQAIQQRDAPKPVISLARAARFGIIGVTLHGPFFWAGFQLLDRRFGREATLRNAVTKSLAGQVTLFPTYVVGVLVYAALLEGCGLREAITRMRERAPTVLVTGTAFWPVVNCLNFLLVPPSRRIAALNVCALVWNAYLATQAQTPAADA